jgi:hypothetical protein
MTMIVDLHYPQSGGIDPRSSAIVLTRTCSNSGTGLGRSAPEGGRFDGGKPAALMAESRPRGGWPDVISQP